MSATVMISGAGGFVGSAVVRRLVCGVADRSLCLDDGVPVHHVVAVLRPGASCERLETLRESDRWSIERCDLTDTAGLRGLIDRREPRVFVDLAMDRTAHTSEDEETRRRAIDGPLQTIFAAMAGEPGVRVVFTSSAWVLPAGDRLDEATPPRPATPYGRNKLRAEELLPELHARTSVDWIALRLFYIFGRYEPSSRLLPYLVDRLSRRQVAELANADAVRDFTDVDVIAGAYDAALRAGPEACGTAFHIGSGQGITVRAFAVTVADVVGGHQLIRNGDIATRDGAMKCQVANTDRAQRVLGWSPTADVYADIRSAARWWLERRRLDPEAHRRSPDSGVSRTT